MGCEVSRQDPTSERVSKEKKRSRSFKTQKKKSQRITSIECFIPINKDKDNSSRSTNLGQNPLCSVGLRGEKVVTLSSELMRQINLFPLRRTSNLDESSNINTIKEKSKELIRSFRESPKLSDNLRFLSFRDRPFRSPNAKLKFEEVPLNSPHKNSLGFKKTGFYLNLEQMKPIVTKTANQIALPKIVPRSSRDKNNGLKSQWTNAAEIDKVIKNHSKFSFEVSITPPVGHHSGHISINKSEKVKKNNPQSTIIISRRKISSISKLNSESEILVGSNALDGRNNTSLMRHGSLSKGIHYAQQSRGPLKSLGSFLNNLNRVDGNTNIMKEDSSEVSSSSTTSIKVVDYCHQPRLPISKSQTASIPNRPNLSTVSKLREKRVELTSAQIAARLESSSAETPAFKHQMQKGFSSTLKSINY